jgi:hypothetical protein
MTKKESIFKPRHQAKISPLPVAPAICMQRQFQLPVRRKRLFDMLLNEQHPLTSTDKDLDIERPVLIEKILFIHTDSNLWGSYCLSFFNCR